MKLADNNFIVHLCKEERWFRACRVIEHVKGILLKIEMSRTTYKKAKEPIWLLIDNRRRSGEATMPHLQPIPLYGNKRQLDCHTVLF